MRVGSCAKRCYSDDILIWNFSFFSSQLPVCFSKQSQLLSSCRFVINNFLQQPFHSVIWTQPLCPYVYFEFSWSRQRRHLFRKAGDARRCTSYKTIEQRFSKQETIIFLDVEVARRHTYFKPPRAFWPSRTQSKTWRST